MKKQVLLIAIAIFSFGIMQAQDIRFGAKAGVNFASIGGDETDGIEGKTGFHIGGLVEIMLTDQFAIQPELLYSAQGAKFEETDSEDGISVTVTDKTKLDYINLPIMAKYYVTEGLALEAGPQIGFLVSANAETELDISGIDDPEFIEFIEDEFGVGDQDISDGTSGIDFGLGLGASYRLDMGVFFGARYTLGLSNINDFEGSDNFKQQNNVFQVSVGYLF
ncbi:MAG: hypothetical protein CMC70_04830 [Flavobacteriaceae bacterium]|nr:hypothetical protein [Flavobacteriaceae bacterium]|tara:strand:+ start:1378 stop:2040 length:663 start_codon:yes stop_codon:yes gene_type:complete